MAKDALAREFELKYGVIYRTHLREGEGFSGRAKRAAREFAIEQDETDEELFLAFGGIEKVRRRLMGKWNDPTQSLQRLNSAEERLLVMTALDEGRLATQEVQYINDVMGNGLFASNFIRANDFIGEYTGVLRLPVESDFHNRYLAVSAVYGDAGTFYIDGQDEGNFMRFINHSSSGDNVRSDQVFHNQRWHLTLRATRDIQVGEQLFWNYGVDYWRGRELPSEAQAPQTASL